MLCIIDFGMGNLRSINRKLRSVGISSEISSDTKVISSADMLILPGVGNFAKAMYNLNDLGLIELLNQKVIIERIPILGICLGMQLFTEYSEEGNCEGFGWVKGRTQKFSFESDNKNRVPHVGWNKVKTFDKSILMDGFDKDKRFYFTHSYHVVGDDPAAKFLKTDYGYEFDSVVEKDNLFAVQFHPEKSHFGGLKIISNFVNFHET